MKSVKPVWITKLPILTLACTGLFAASVQAGEIVLTASRDNTLFESDTGALSNGKGQYCFTGLTSQPAARRTLLEFDIASVIPDGVTIVQVSLTLHMSKTRAGSTPVEAHRLLVHWGEGDSDADGPEGDGAPAQPGDATWLHTEFDSAFWTNPGGDFDPTPSATTAVDSFGFYTWSSPELAADVQNWLNGTDDNHGWILTGDESGTRTAKRFDTREHPDPSLRPQLHVIYQPPCIGDWNSDGTVNTSDFLAFLNEWAAGSPAADLNGDTMVNTQDFLFFLNAWNTGC